MPATIAVITMSLDGFVTAPGDGPGKGLGIDGEVLHEWVFGGSWRYEDEIRSAASGLDAEFLEEATARFGAVVAGRATYEAASHWGGSPPGGVPFVILTHRTEDASHGDMFTFVEGIEDAVERARSFAGDRDVSIMGGAATIRQALDAGLLDELTIIVSPVVLGAGKRLFEGFERRLLLEQIDARQSAHATFLSYRISASSR